MAGVALKVESKDRGKLAALAVAMKAEENGALLRKDLIAGLKVAVAPGKSQVQETLRGWPHGGRTVAQPALGPFLASKTMVQVRLSGKATGVNVRVPRTPTIRGFRKAATMLNSGNAWRHKVFGRDVWVEQVSPNPHFFDTELAKRKDEYREAVLRAIENMKRRIRK